jgi:hypothetical protein
VAKQKRPSLAQEEGRFSVHRNDKRNQNADELGVGRHDDRLWLGSDALLGGIAPGEKK